MKVVSFEEAMSLVSRDDRERVQERSILSELIEREPVLARFIGYETLKLRDDETRTVYVCDGNLRKVYGLHNVRIMVGGISLWTRLACFSEKRCLLCDMRRNYFDRITASSHYIVFNVYDPIDKKIKVLFLNFGFNANYGILRELADKTNFDLSGLKISLGKRKVGSNQKGVYLIVGYEVGRDGSPLRYKVLEYIRQKGLKLYDIESLLDIQDDLRVLEKLGFDLSLYDLSSYRFDVLHSDEDDLDSEMGGMVEEDEPIPVEEKPGISLKVNSEIEDLFLSGDEIIKQSIELVKAEMKTEKRVETVEQNRGKSGENKVEVKGREKNDAKVINLQDRWMEEKLSKLSIELTEEQLEAISSW